MSALLVVCTLLSVPAAASASLVVAQHRIPGGAAAEAIVSGADGALWFTESQPDRIGRLTLAGVFTDFPLAAGSHPLGIAAGPDGAVWFTEAAADRIGRITTAGAVSTYPLMPGSRPVGIATGADGALWFTEYAGNRIGRLATDGTFADYPLPVAQAQPVGITAGPDGAVWFTEFGAFPGGRIGRIDLATRSIAEFPACASPLCAGNPEGIATGPDGALWFTEQANGANKIGRITVAGALTEFTAPFGPFGIVAGPDSALWFSESGMALPGAPTYPGQLGRLTTSGVLDELPLLTQTGESPNDITVGPDRAIWIADGQTIDRVTGFQGASVPRITGLSMTRRSFRPAVRPPRAVTSIRFRLSTAAAWIVEIQRLRPGRRLGPGDCRPARPRLAKLPTCVAVTTVATRQRRLAPAGRQRLGFDGYGDAGSRLDPGAYRARVTAYGGRVGANPPTRSIGFTILR